MLEDRTGWQTRYRLWAVAAILLLPPTAGSAADVFIAGASGGTGSGSLLPHGSATPQVALLPLQESVSLRYEANRVYVIQGPRDEVMILIPSAWRAPVTQFSIGRDTDPRDIAVVAADEIYVSRRESAELIRVDVFSGEVLARVDLAPLADEDGLPEMTRMARIDDRVYVLCERIDRSRQRERPRGSLVAVVDVSTDRLVDAVPAEAGLRGLPMGLDRARDLMVMGTRLVVTAEAGVVELDPAQPAARMLVSADQLGGAPGPVALVSNRIGFAAVETADGHRVVPVDLLKSQVGAPLAGLSGGTVSDLAIDEGRLVVADRGSFDADLAAGIYLYDVGTHERLHGPLRVGHKPLRLAVVAEQRITAVASSSTSPATDEGSRLQPAFPNPFNATLIVPFVLSREMAVRLSVTDALGRRVRRLHAGILPVGSHRRIWDGRDDEGRRVASGVYVARLSTDDGISAQRLLHLR